MQLKSCVSVVVTLLALVCAAPAWAQKVTTVEELTLKQTLNQLVGPIASKPAGDALALATELEVATTQAPTSSGGFVFKLDPSTGLLVRATNTFGPWFADRAITSGEGQVSVGVSFSSASYDKLGDRPLNGLPLGAVRASSPSVARAGSANLALTARIVTLSGTVGVSENLDVGVNVPLVSIKLDGTTLLTDGNGGLVRLAQGGGVYAGAGDISGFAKYRFYKFGTEQPDPGGLAAVITMTLPTGDADNLRGLGVTRTRASLVASGGKGRIWPHANVGYEWWSASVGAAAEIGKPPTVTALNQFMYAAGVEAEVTPKVTAIADFLGRRIRHAGQVDYLSFPTTTAGAGVTALESLVAISKGIDKTTFVPGVKVNLKDKFLLSLSALISLHDDGLHTKVIPVVGATLTF